MVQHWTDIQMKETKRNKRELDTHLKMARFSQNLDDPEGKWRNKDGRPIATLKNSKEAQLINEWMVNHPESTNKSLCARDLGLDRKTVRKWWNQIEEQSENYLQKKVEREIIRDITEDFNRGAGFFFDEERVPNFD